MAVSSSTSSVYGASGIFFAEEARDLRPFLWMAGTMMCEGVSPASWMMYSPRSVSTDLDAVLLEEVVQVHLLGDHRLALDHARGAVGSQDLEHDRVGLLRRLGPVDADAVAACSAPRAPRAARAASRASARRIAAPGARRRSPSTGSAKSARAWPQDAVPWRGGSWPAAAASASASRVARGSRGTRVRSWHALPDEFRDSGWPANGSSPAPRGGRRCSSGSRSRRRGRRRRRWPAMSSTLSATMAAEISGCWIANVPPNPQHSLSRDELDQLDVARAAEQGLGLLDDPHLAQRVAGGVPRHPDGRPGP